MAGERTDAVGVHGTVETRGSVDTVYRAGGPDVAWREAGDDIVVLDVPQSVYFGLNRTGALLWRRLVDDAGATVPELVDALAAGDGVPREQATTEVAAFLGDLREAGLLRTG